MNSYMDLLNEIKIKSLKYGEEMQEPCSQKEAVNLASNVNVEFGIELSTGYIEFLKIHNGLDWNGLMIYASEDSISKNESKAKIYGLNNCS